MAREGSASGCIGALLEVPDGLRQCWQSGNGLADPHLPRPGGASVSAGPAARAGCSRRAAVGRPRAFPPRAGAYRARPAGGQKSPCFRRRGVRDRPDAGGLSSCGISPLAPDPVPVPVEPVGVGWQHPEPSVGDVPAVQVGRGRGDAHVRVARIARGPALLGRTPRGPEPCSALPGAPLGIAEAVHVAHVRRDGEQKIPSLRAWSRARSFGETSGTSMLMSRTVSVLPATTTRKVSPSCQERTVASGSAVGARPRVKTVSSTAESAGDMHRRGTGHLRGTASTLRAERRSCGRGTMERG